MKALIVGGGGQVGRALAATAPAGLQVHAPLRAELDITNAGSVQAALAAFQPDILLNAAAYTAVDRAETEEDAAEAVNATAVGILAGAARAAGARFVHISTDFVFDGTAGTPYAVDAATNPLGAYGRTKLAGEQAAGPEALIVRTAWVYGPTGGNFVRTMLRLFAERPEVRVVADQVGTPTYAPWLAATLWSLAARQANGLFHYTESGVASWYDFAVAIQEDALSAGLLNKPATIIPIATAQFPTPARRPAYSVLDKMNTWDMLGEPAPHWRVALRHMMQEIRNNG